MADRDAVFDKPMTYEESMGNGKIMVTYRGSALGSCIGALVRSRMGITASAPSDFMQTKFDEGSAWEERVIEAAFPKDDATSKYTLVRGKDLLARYGEVIEGGSTGSSLAQVEVTIATGKTTRVKLHPDAFVIDKSTGEVYVVEVKFLSEGFAKTKEDGDLGEVYEWQFAAEMVGTDLPGLYVIARKQMGEGDNDKNVVGIGNITMMKRNEPKHTLADIRARVNEVEKCVREGTVPKCPLPLMYPCGYWAEHDEKEDESCDDIKLALIVSSYVALTKEKDAAERELAELKIEMAERLGELDRQAAKIGAVRVSVTSSRPGNVSWKSAYDALAKMSGMKVEQDAYRGKEVAGGIKVEIDKTEEGT